MKIREVLCGAVFSFLLVSLCVDECRRVHFHLPYKWEVFDGITWADLQHMEDIERDFCDPSRTQRSEVTSHRYSGVKKICCWWGADWNVSVFSCGDHIVDFERMSCELQPVRRLSTVSSVTKPPHYSLTTRWLWYYKVDLGNWVEYGQLVSQSAVSLWKVLFWPVNLKMNADPDHYISMIEC